MRPLVCNFAFSEDFFNVIFRYPPLDHTNTLCMVAVDDTALIFHQLANKASLMLIHDR